MPIDRTDVNSAWRHVVRRLLPPVAYERLREWKRWRHLSPARGRVRFGHLGGTTPVSIGWGLRRGTPVDRHYIETFLHEQRDAIRGRVLEIEDRSYVDRFGHALTQVDVLHLDTWLPDVTIVGDMRLSGLLAEGAYDCLIITQMLHLVYDMEMVLKHFYLALRPGGVMLATLPGITPIDWGGAIDSWYWSLTKSSAHELFGSVFGMQNIEIKVFGNVFAATCLLQGIALEDVGQARLETYDPSYPVTIALRAVKPLEGREH